MKYFEFTEPYCALISAASKENALKIYKQDVADLEDNTDNEIKEVDLAYARDQIVKSYIAYETERDFDENIEFDYSPLKTENLILIDGDLI